MDPYNSYDRNTLKPIRGLSGRTDYDATFRQHLDTAIKHNVIKLKIKTDSEDNVDPADKGFVVCRFRNGSGTYIFRYGSDCYWTGHMNMVLDPSSNGLCSVVSYIKSSKIYQEFKKKFPHITFVNYKSELENDRHDGKPHGYLFNYAYDPENPDNSKWRFGYNEYLKSNIHYDDFPDDKTTPVEEFFERARAGRLNRLKEQMRAKYGPHVFFDTHDAPLDAVEAHLKLHKPTFVLSATDKLEGEMIIRVAYLDSWDNPQHTEIKLGSGERKICSELEALRQHTNLLTVFKKRYPALIINSVTALPATLIAKQAYLLHTSADDSLKLIFLNENGAQHSLPCNSAARYKRSYFSDATTRFSDNDNQLYRESLDTYYNFTVELTLIELLRPYPLFSTIASASLRGTKEKLSIHYKFGQFILTEGAFEIDATLRGSTFQDLAAYALAVYPAMDNHFRDTFLKEYGTPHVFSQLPPLTQDKFAVLAKLPKAEVHWLRRNGKPKVHHPANKEELKKAIKEATQYHTFKAALADCRASLGADFFTYSKKKPRPIKGVHVSKYMNSEKDLRLHIGFYDPVKKAEEWRSGIAPEELKKTIQAGHTYLQLQIATYEETEAYRLEAKVTKVSGTYNHTPTEGKFALEYSAVQNKQSLHDYILYCVDQYKMVGLIRSLGMGLLFIKPEHVMGVVLEFKQAFEHHGIAMPNLGIQPEKPFNPKESWNSTIKRFELEVSELISVVTEQINTHLAKAPTDFLPLLTQAQKKIAIDLIPAAAQENAPQNNELNVWKAQGFIVEAEGKIQITRKAAAYLLLQFGFLKKTKPEDVIMKDEGK